MSQVNRFGLFLWLMVIAGLNIKSPFGNWFDFVCFSIVAVAGSVCLLTKRAVDGWWAARKCHANNPEDKSWCGVCGQPRRN